MNDIQAQQIIDHFSMRPLPREGGWYIETYRAAEKILQSGLDIRYSGDRCHSTSILYLLTSETCSKMHRIKSDEIFHYHLGNPVKMIWLCPDGSSRNIVIGPDILGGQEVQVIVPRGVWQGARLIESSRWCLMSCTVAPGFEYDDYEHGNQDDLAARWPKQRDEILKLI